MCWFGTDGSQPKNWNNFFPFSPFFRRSNSFHSKKLREYHSGKIFYKQMFLPHSFGRRRCLLEFFTLNQNFYWVLALSSKKNQILYTTKIVKIQHETWCKRHQLPLMRIEFHNSLNFLRCGAIFWPFDSFILFSEHKTQSNVHEKVRWSLPKFTWSLVGLAD